MTGNIQILSSAEAKGVLHKAPAKYVQVCWVLDCNFDRECQVKIGSAKKAWECRPANTIHLYRPGTPYWEDYNPYELATHSVFVCFNLDNHQILRPLTDNSQKYSRIVDPNKILIAKMLKIVHIGECEGNDGFWRAQACLCEIINLMLLAERMDEFTIQICSDKEKVLSNMADSVQAFIRDNISRNIKLEEIADHIGVSLSTLTHFYKSETGETPMSTHQNLRMNQICTLLLKGESLKMIANVMGFNDVYHLSKYFKRIEGCSPKSFLGSYGDSLL